MYVKWRCVIPSLFVGYLLVLTSFMIRVQDQVEIGSGEAYSVAYQAEQQQAPGDRLVEQYRRWNSQLQQSRMGSAPSGVR